MGFASPDSDYDVRFIDVRLRDWYLRMLATAHIGDVALCYHYSHMARRNAHQFLQQKMVKLKKYFYVLRPLLAIRWIEAGMGLPPVPFAELIAGASPAEDCQCTAWIRLEGWIDCRGKPLFFGS